MPRPRKCRRVCSMPRCTHFAPFPRCCDEDIVMTVDEYETIRLIDFEGLTQEQCADQMHVARTTAQAIYSSARRKLAECIVLGRQMNITGGDIQVCEKGRNACGHCCKRFGSMAEKLVEKLTEKEDEVIKAGCQNPNSRRNSREV